MLPYRFGFALYETPGNSLRNIWKLCQELKEIFTYIPQTVTNYGPHTPSYVNKKVFVSHSNYNSPQRTKSPQRLLKI